MSYGESVKARRNALGWSQITLANAAGLASAAAISNIERDRKKAHRCSINGIEAALAKGAKEKVTV